ncbi:hypothetical protein [Dyadobacter sp. Leaf189]|uniref:hypothetical protein n=1 Tax=Dyadobacter sp. Leaf189 TaxID=1736295 RepID=UPI0006FD8597|nr:hypothetical protein [Dyadobacter sp. Leaf189]KQS33490.1 hypothetical protein ASG33_05300 [Dyadobacter sp. Leaf189]
MKRILTILLACSGTFALAQKKCHLSRSIDDDGKTMSIRVTGTIDGREINFSRSFDVAELSRDERTELRDEVMESIASGELDVPEPPQPVEAPAPVPPVPALPEEPVVYSSIQPEPEFSRSRDPHRKAFDGLESTGYRKHVKYNPQTGELFLQYHFKKNEEEFVFEKTVNAEDKSESERQRIIDNFEREIELPGKGMDM